MFEATEKLEWDGGDEVTSTGRVVTRVDNVIRLPLTPNPKQAYGDRKAPVHLVPPSLVLEASGAMGEGAAKYGAYNWRSTKVEAMTYVGAVLRHMAAYADGEDVDPESTTGKSHLAGAVASLAILIDATRGGCLIDNRPHPGPAPTMTRDPAARPQDWRTK